MHYYAPTLGSVEVLASAFFHAGKLALEGQHAHITLAVPTKGNLDGLISSCIGDQLTRALQRDNRVDLGGVTLHLATERIPVGHRGPVLALFAKIPHVKTLAKSPNATHLLYVPWAPDELPAFQKLFPTALPIPDPLRTDPNGPTTKWPNRAVAA